MSESETERQTDRQTDRDRQNERERERERERAGSPQNKREREGERQFLYTNARNRNHAYFTEKHNTTQAKRSPEKSLRDDDDCR